MLKFRKEQSKINFLDKQIKPNMSCEYYIKLLHKNFQHNST